MTKKYTVAEANALLPYLAPTLVELREKYEAAAKIRAGVARTASGNGHAPSPDRAARTLARVNELIERLETWEIELRDVNTGLIDFPATIEGRDAWLCWRLGEPEVGYWHEVTEGFASRKPL